MRNQYNPDRVHDAIAVSGERRYRAYVANAPVGIFVFNEPGCFVDVNEAACRMVGYTRQELLSLRLADLVVAGDTDRGNPFERLTRTGHVRWEGRLRDKKGGSIYGFVEAVTLAEGQYMACFVDQTERRTLQAQLHQVRKIESVGRLAAGVAHDFNNMLSPILGYAELLLADLAEGTDCYGYSLEIKNAVERSRNLTRQLLAFSRKQVLSLDTLDLRDIVSGVEALLRQALREDIVLTLDLGETPCPVRADAGQVEQILMNLAANAQDAMPDGGEWSIAVRMAILAPGERPSRPGLPSGPHVLLEVADTGQGMDSATAEQAFDPFFSTKGKGRRGLGLSTVYGIVKQHGGGVFMGTEVGKGTVFSLYFPREAEAQRTSRKQKEGGRSVPEASVAGCRRKGPGTR